MTALATTPGPATATKLHRRDPELLLRGADSMVALAEIGRELASGKTTRVGIERALSVLARCFAVDRSVLYVANGKPQTLSIEASFGIAADQFRPRLGRGVAGRVAESGEPIVVPTVRHEPAALSELTDVPRWATLDWSQICVPVAVSGERGGALSAYFTSDRDPEIAERLRVLQVVAFLLSQTLRTAHLERALEPVLLEIATTSRPGAFEYSNMVGASPAMHQVYELVGQVARTNATALIRGESGSGKELVAHAIHYNSPRARAPFVRVNCAALPESLIESELFGYERGAFTGAHARKKGRFELAQDGTLFLDEIAELSLVTQAKLLRVLQSREFERLGGTETLSANVRVVAATNKDIEKAVEAGTFREDLYYRLNVFTLTVPPLRDRRGDIAPLAEYFLSKYAQEHGRQIRRIASGALELLCQHAWPGNVRELENTIERAIVVCHGSIIEEQDLPESVRQARPNELDRPRTLAEAVTRLEKKMIEDALSEHRGNCARAARALGTTERIIRYKAGKYGIGASRFRS